jgi:hypothetical protein
MAGRTIVPLRRLGSLAAALLLLGSCPWAFASSLVVPDDQPTIQAALDAGPDSVLVKDGYYPERVEVRRGVALLSFPSSNGYGPEALPRVQGLSILDGLEPSSETVSIRGLRFLGRVLLERRGWEAQKAVTFEVCRMDSGMFGPRDLAPGVLNFGILILNVRGCTVVGGMNIGVYSANITLNTILGSGLRLMSEGYNTVQGNYVTGPAEVGIDAFNLVTRYGSVEYNTLRGTDVGIRVSGHAFGNDVQDCAGHGIEGDGVHVVTIRGNRVRRCGGDGILALDQLSIIAGNIVTEAQGAGIHTSGKTAAIDSNVVGRCGGPGMVTEGNQAASVTHNTSYLNQGSGIVTASYSLSHNVSFGNTGYGLEWGGGSQDRGCNDWFANKSGGVKGGTPDPTDLATDPLFCDIAADDVRLRADSPLLDAPGCGLIGALGLGCDVTAAVNRPGGEDATALLASPIPSRGGVRFSWRPTDTPVSIEVFDVSGARRWARVLPANEAGFSWAGTDQAGRALPSGTYFARIAGQRLVGTTRVILTR